MQLIGTMHRRPVRLLYLNGYANINPPAPHCECCDEDKYMVASRVGKATNFVLICESCHAEYDLQEDVQL